MLTHDITVCCAGGGGHTGVMTEKGELYLWGRGRNGQLGRGDKKERCAACTCVIPVCKIICVFWCSMAFYRRTPVHVDALSKYNVIDLSLGGDHTVVIATPLS